MSSGYLAEENHAYNVNGYNSYTINFKLTNKPMLLIRN